MSDIPTIRYLLAKFLPDPRLVRAFEQLGDMTNSNTLTAEEALAVGGDAQTLATLALTLLAVLSDASFVTIAAEATLDNERRLTSGNLITVTDGGAGSTVTIAVDDATLVKLAAVQTLLDKTLDRLRVEDGVTASAPVASGTIPVETASGTRYIMVSSTP